jgi:ATP-dependent DNA helicase RecG
MLAALEAGELNILVGTHAVISADVRFQSLALAVVDEQHKCAGLPSSCPCDLTAH